jgi:hypothetical protein
MSLFQLQSQIRCCKDKLSEDLKFSEDLFSEHAQGNHFNAQNIQEKMKCIQKDLYAMRERFDSFCARSLFHSEEEHPYRMTGKALFNMGNTMLQICEDVKTFNQHLAIVMDFMLNKTSKIRPSSCWHPLFFAKLGEALKTFSQIHDYFRKMVHRAHLCFENSFWASHVKNFVSDSREMRTFFAQHRKFYPQVFDEAFPFVFFTKEERQENKRKFHDHPLEKTQFGFLCSDAPAVSSIHAYDAWELEPSFFKMRKLVRALEELWTSLPLSERYCPECKSQDIQIEKGTTRLFCRFCQTHRCSLCGKMDGFREPEAFGVVSKNVDYHPEDVFASEKSHSEEKGSPFFDLVADFDAHWLSRTAHLALNCFEMNQKVHSCPKDQRPKHWWARTLYRRLACLFFIVGVEPVRFAMNYVKNPILHNWVNMMTRNSSFGERECWLFSQSELSTILKMVENNPALFHP